MLYKKLIKYGCFTLLHYDREYLKSWSSGQVGHPYVSRKW